MIDFGTVKPGTTLYIPFATYDSNDPTASVTMTGLAVTDIEIYKDGGTTQRASDNGYTLLDTDGIDFDSLTGIHGFSVSLADNSDAGFYAAGSQYWVVVSSVTVDAGTVSFIAATFRIGLPDAVLDTTIATLASQTSFTLTAGPAEDDALNGCVCYIHDVASAVQGGFAVVADYTGATKTVTLTAGVTFTAAATDNISFFPPSNIGFVAAGATAAANLKSACDNYSATRGLCGTAVPAAAADAAGGLVISDAGGLDVDAKLANTNEVTAARMGALTDLIDGGRLDLLIDAILLDTGTTLQGEVDGLQATLGVAGAGLTAVPWNAAWDAEVESEANDALVANHLDHLLAVTYDPASKPGAADALLNELVESDGGVSRYTVNALENAPSGTGASAASIADAVWDEAQADHVGAGTFGEVATETAAVLADTGTDGVVVAAASKTGYALTAATGLGNQTANLTGNLSGSVGSVTAGVTVTTNNDKTGYTASTVSDKTGYSLSAAGIQAVWDALVSALTTVGSIGKRLVDYLTGDAYTRIGAPAGASLAADVAAVKVDTAATLADTGTDGVVIPQAQADKVWSTAARILTAGTNIALAKGTGVTGFNDLAAADIRTAVGLATANLDTQLAALPTAAENRAEMDTNSTQLAAIAAFGAPPSAATVASQVRTELTTELGRIDAAVTTRSTVTEAQVNAQCDTAISDADLATAANLAIIAGYLDTEVAALTSELAKVPKSDGAVAMNATANTAIVTAMFARAFSAAYSGLTFDEILKLVASAVAGKCSGLDTTTATYRNLADTADVIVATVDTVGNRSAVTRTP